MFGHYGWFGYGLVITHHMVGYVMFGDFCQELFADICAAFENAVCANYTAWLLVLIYITKEKNFKYLPPVSNQIYNLGIRSWTPHVFLDRFCLNC